MLMSRAMRLSALRRLPNGHQNCLFFEVRLPSLIHGDGNEGFLGRLLNTNDCERSGLPHWTVQIPLLLVALLLGTIGVSSTD